MLRWKDGNNVEKGKMVLRKMQLSFRHAEIILRKHFKLNGFLK